MEYWIHAQTARNRCMDHVAVHGVVMVMALVMGYLFAA